MSIDISVDIGPSVAPDLDVNRENDIEHGTPRWQFGGL